MMSNQKFLVLFFGLTSATCTPKRSDDAARSEPTSIEPAPTQAPVPEPAKPEPPVGDPGDAVALASSTMHACVLQRAGTVACWGSNDRGELGQDHHDEVTGAVLVRGLDDAVAISSSTGATCALRRSGPVVCWGDPSMGELGNGKTGEPRGLVEVVEVRDVTGLFGGSFATCATTASGRTWCWGTLTQMSAVYDLYALPEDQRSGPIPLDLEGVRALELGINRSYSWRADGSVLVWSGSDNPPKPIPDAVEIRSGGGIECFVRASGEVACEVDGKRAKVVEELHGARQLSLSIWSTPEITVLGILPDGTLTAGSVNDKETPTFADPHDLIALAPEYSFDVLGIRSDGRVFVWKSDPTGKHDYAPHEIVLPDPSKVGPAIPYVAPPDPIAPESSLPNWCSVEFRSTFPGDKETYEEMAKQLGSDSESLCDLTLDEIMHHDSSECLSEGPWLVQQADSDIALIVRIDGERVGRISELGNYGDEGPDGSLEIVAWKIRSRSPVDVWLHVTEAKVVEPGDQHRHVVLSSLAGRSLLRTDVTIDMNKANPRGQVRRADCRDRGTGWSRCRPAVVAIVHRFLRASAQPPNRQSIVARYAGIPKDRPPCRTAPSGSG